MAKQKTKQQKSQKAKVQRTQDLPQQTKCEEKFAEGLCFKKLFSCFLVGSVIGTIYEELLYGVQTWYATGSWEWTVRRGVIYGPFNVIYGFGAVVMVYLLLRKKYTNWQIFLYASLLGGIVEYVVSLLQEVFTHTTSWDYSNYFLNINGRTTVPFMVVWGILGLVLVKIAYPFVSEVVEKIPVKIGNIIYVVLVVFMAFDMLISWTAIIRQTLRHNHIAPFTPIGEFYDTYYNDEFLRQFFPNMVHEDLEK